jgi:hypothetical protein
LISNESCLLAFLRILKGVKNIFGEYSGDVFGDFFHEQNIFSKNFQVFAIFKNF